MVAICAGGTVDKKVQWVQIAKGEVTYDFVLVYTSTFVLPTSNFIHPTSSIIHHPSSIIIKIDNLSF